jgi:hypothetical protein
MQEIMQGMLCGDLLNEPLANLRIRYRRAGGIGKTLIAEDGDLGMFADL